ncbi:uncharacterized protein N7515_000575 [Penicillium bovifimosum]|uniref:Uncharacterized protein n=1 Tax=Penicillium bovifimosum TaxID=126998 RepID=A0A9W9HFU2_9EURO|nr:uncharacterized protein N7515_000575 [Penicillium bovifimosum]KAJ5146011.1 hypothetical protein N7515_000575 [Penicillium bovifimosum]
MPSEPGDVPWCHAGNGDVKSALDDVSSPNSIYVNGLNTCWIEQPGSTSGQWFGFPSYCKYAIGVKGIYGCTLVIVVSEKGVYISHIWENPVFIDGCCMPTKDDWFKKHTLDALRDGTEYTQSVASLIGTDQNPGVLNAIYAPKVFVLTPFATDLDKQWPGIATQLRYQHRAKELARMIAEIIPGSGGDGITVGYTRTGLAESSKQPGVAGRTIVEVQPFHMWLVPPGHCPFAGLQIGRWRLWVEDKLITYQDFWCPPEMVHG